MTLKENQSLPHIRQSVVDAGGGAARPWFLWFSAIDVNLRALSSQVDAIVPSGGGGISPTANVIGIESVLTGGSLAAGTVTVSLVNDQASVSGHWRYGSDNGGNKGWAAVAGDFANSANIALTTDANGVVTFDLTHLTDTGAGTLLAITRDAWGRITGTRAATITGTANRVTVTNGTATAGVPTIDIAATYAGQASIVTLGTVTTGTWQATTLAPGFGGTGLTTYAIGDLIYASGATTLARLADVSTGNALLSGGIGAAPGWGKIGLGTHVSGTLPITNGGTGQATAAAGFDALAPTTTSQDLILRGASSNGRLAVGSNGQVLGVTAGAVGWVTPISGGSVTSVGLAAPTQFNISGSPVTGAGTLTFAWNTQTANTVMAGPATGSSATPSFRSLVAADIAAALPTDYISGLKLIWNSATSISVGTGSATIPSTGKLETVASLLTLSSLSLTASTFYHLYLFDNAGVPTIECVTTAPATPYQGTARAKTGDTTRRYLGSVLTDVSGNVAQFTHVATRMLYSNGASSAAPYRVLSNGVATTSTAISCAGIVPVTAIALYARCINLSTSTTVIFQQGTGALTYITVAFTGGGIPNQNILADIPTSTQSCAYLYGSAPSGGGAYLDIYGYAFER